MDNREIDISELEPSSAAVLTAALMYARQNPGRQSHAVPLNDFYQLAGLGDEVYLENCMAWIVAAMSATVFSLDSKAQVLRGWPVFRSFTISQSGVEFAVDDMAVDATLFPISLSSIKACESGGQDCLPS